MLEKENKMSARLDHTPRRSLSRFATATLAALMLGCGLTTPDVMAQGKPVPAQIREVRPVPNTQDAPSGPAVIGPTMTLVTGKSTLLRLDAPIDRVSVGNPAVADVTIISPRELYLLGKTFGSTNVILWSKGGPTTAIDVVINIDAGLLQDTIAKLLPGEKDIHVTAAADSVVLSGVASSAMQVQQAVAIAESYVRNINKGLVLPIVAGDGTAKAGTTISVGQATGGSTGVAVATAGARVINLLNVSAPQQVMLEVVVAEVSRTLLEKLGTQFNWRTTSGNWIYSILTGFLSNSAGVGQIANTNGNAFTFDAAKDDGLIKILAEPTIVAISGQEGSFLAGGKIFIPTASTNQFGFATITLTEKEFGVGLKFTPTVLEAGRIHLKVAPEVSELAQTGSPFTTVNGVTSVIPSFTTRRAETTVQLQDGQSFAIAGLIKNNVTETVKRFPILGELPYIGALFRSSEFQSDKTELMFLVTPRLVKAVSQDVALPTDNFTPPTRAEFFLEGKMEGSAAEPRRRDVPPNPPVNQGGFEVK
jgi:pilus assembly protein CpaC